MRGARALRKKNAKPSPPHEGKRGSETPPKKSVPLCSRLGHTTHAPYPKEPQTPRPLSNRKKLEPITGQCAPFTLDS